MNVGTAAAAGVLPLALSLIPAATSQSQSSAANCGANCAVGSSLGSGPVPLLATGNAVSWWFVFKLNGSVFPGCGTQTPAGCPFGGLVRNYPSPAGLQYVYASSENSSLKQGSGCAGETTSDPIGATYSEIYNGSYHYVVWNDQFKGDPPITGCSGDCDAPWGHSKGMVAWDDDGNGLVMQVTTPSWPASGSSRFPRKTGNTLGCVIDNDVEFSQQFFALQLSKDDLVDVLKALQNASVVTDTSNPQLVNNGGPPDVTQLVSQLGTKSHSTTVTQATLSSGVELISKPSNEPVPPWQMVSAQLGSVSLRVASWWDKPQIPTTTGTTTVQCWDPKLPKPGAVSIAATGRWAGKEFGLEGGPGSPVGNANHAKIGVSTDAGTSYVIFGDMNQQGTLAPVPREQCSPSQNGRGGLFYVLTNPQLYGGVSDLISGGSAPVASSSAQTTPSTTMPRRTSKGRTR